MTSHFSNFISKSNMYSTAIGFLISTQIIVIVNTFFDNLIAPLINYILVKHNHNGLKECIIKIDEIDIEIGIFLLSIIKFLCILLLIYLFITYFQIQINEN